MAVIITSRTFYDEYLGIAGGGVEYLPGSIGDKIRCDMEFHIKWSAEGKRIQFINSDKSIRLINDLDPTSFIQQGFRKNDTIEVSGSTSNDGTWTITKVEDRAIFVSVAPINETSEDVDIFGTTPVTALDFYFNLVPNGSQIDFLSLQDEGTMQRFAVNGIDANDLVTISNFLVGTDSFGWVTQNLVDPNTGETDEVTIIGMGVVNYEQRFKMTTFFYNTPVWLREQSLNFENQTLPDLFIDGESLHHVARFDAKFTFADPNIPHTGTINGADGIVAWFNHNAVGSRPEYYVDSITYIDALTLAVIQVPDLNRKTNVEVVIKSRSNKFDTATGIVIGTMYCPMVLEKYTNTTKVLRENLFMDRFIGTLSDSATGGDFEGTDYQQLKDINLVTFAPGTATIKFALDFSSVFKDELKSNEDDDRRDAWWIAIKDITGIPTTADAERLALLIEAPNLAYNQDNPDLFELIDPPKLYNYPDELENDKTDARGFEGSPIYSRLKFRIESLAVNGVTPTLRGIDVQIVAEKDGFADLVLEEKNVDATFIRKLNGQQTIDVEQSRGFISYFDDPRNRFRVLRVPANDGGGTKTAFELQYGFGLRWEYWRQVIPLTEGVDVDAWQQLPFVNQRWDNFDNVNGWNVKMKWKFTIEGYDGHITEFIVKSDIRSIQGDEEPESGPIFQSKVQYFTEDGLTELGGVLVQDGITKIVATFVGDFSTLAPGQIGWAGFMFGDVEGQGGIALRRFAGSHTLSESDSPWSPVDPDPMATSSVVGQITLNVYNTDTITLEGYFDTRKFFEGYTEPIPEGARDALLIFPQFRNADWVLIFPTIMPKFEDCLILNEDGSPILLEDLEGLKQEVCPV